MLHSRKKISVAAALLLICAILLGTASYAWLTISTAPEISGIDTNIGANGSLEIALLSDETYTDPTLIRTSIGDSLALENPTVSNRSWGNVIDLSDSSYGLGQISMLPARLNVGLGDSGYGVVGNSILSFAKYTSDGRIEMAAGNTVYASYLDEKFIYSRTEPGHGVRGIGALEGLTIQQAALANAQAQVKSYKVAAASAAASAWKANGPAILNVYEKRYGEEADSFDDSDVAALRDTATRLLNAYGYLDAALRQGIIGYAAAVIENEQQFLDLSEMVENTLISLSVIGSNSPVEIPGEFSTWISDVESGKRALQNGISRCDELQGGEYSWEQIEELQLNFFDPAKTYLGQWKMNEKDAYEKRLLDTQLAVPSDNGIMADIAYFVGTYESVFTYEDDSLVQVSVFMEGTRPALEALSAVLGEREAASGDREVITAVIKDVYGFAVDLAFRCNSPGTSSLLLQTAPETRLEGAEGVEAAQGGGSYMSFTSDRLTSEQMIRMMDAIRVGFIDNQNNLVALAKLNTSNHTNVENSITAPLYLYDFKVSVDGSISIGERLKETDDKPGAESAITELTDGVPVVLTAIVWLDGDHVDNGMAAISGKSMSGQLNLQFASSAELRPAFGDGNGTLNGGTVTPSGPNGSDDPTPDTPVAPTPNTPVIEYPVYVSGIRVTGANAADVLGDGTVSYDPASNTLRLNGAVIEGARSSEYSSPLGIFSVDENGLNIVLGEKPSVIQNCSYGIEIRGELTISGGSLTIQSAATGIWAETNDITINGGNITIIGDQHAITGNINGGTLTVNSGKVMLLGAKTDISGGSEYGIGVLHTVLGNDAHVIASGATSASYAVPTLAEGASGKSRTSEDAEFVSGIVYNYEDYFEFIGDGVDDGNT